MLMRRRNEGDDSPRAWWEVALIAAFVVFLVAAVIWTYGAG